MSTRTFRLKGWHVLAMLLSFFALVAGVNAIFVTLAVRSFPGEEEKKPYLQGLHYNDSLSQRRAQEALGWSAEIASARLQGDVAIIELVYRSADDAPIYALEVRGQIGRPASRANDQALVFTSTSDGAYRAEIEGLAPGAWKLTAHAQNTRGEAFDLDTKLVLE